jgi:hypothetical protein
MSIARSLSITCLGLSLAIAYGCTSRPASTAHQAGTVATGGACTSDRDCVADNECVKSVCVGDSEAKEADDARDGGAEVDDEAEAESAKGDGGHMKIACAAPCPSGQECENGVCVPDTD